MPESSITSHLVAIAIGFLAKWVISSSPPAVECPACILTCGSVSCPAHSCSTGHIEIGNFSLLVVAGLIAISFVLSWWVSRFGTAPKDTNPTPKPALVDGRRALGQSLGWRPETRG